MDLYDTDTSDLNRSWKAHGLGIAAFIGGALVPATAIWAWVRRQM